MADASTFSKIRIGIASPEEIRAWSYGEVKKPETINYRTFKPERDGLFCERIFGPVKDWECHCGRYKKVKFKGIVCDRCGVEVTRSKVRRERMGHIELATPVCHIWYLKGVPSPLSLVLDITPRPLEKVLYFASYIVTFVDRQRINNELEDIRQAVQQELDFITEDRETIADRLEREFRKEVEEHTGDDLDEETLPWDEETIQDKRKYLAERIRQEEKDASERLDELQESLTLLEKIEKRQLLNEDQYRSLERLIEVLTRRLDESYAGIVRSGMGGTAIKELLDEVDLDTLSRELRNEVANTQGPKRLRAIKRLEVVEAFLSSGAHPSWMILECVPVISPELRPMVQLDGGRFATSDLNDLYRRIINRNNRLKKITEIRAPESIINHEKRLLQEAVDALIDNGRRTRPVVGSNNRPLKSLSDMLKGKEGRFRKNLLGKRVDYSGRSVIVAGPHLKLHQCGLPKEMALELFKPFVMKTLVERQYTTNIKTAKRMIDKMKPEVWDALEEVIREHPVMLNRAPTLHRLGIQAFEPVLVDGKAIQIHPLVCHAFNADFDGDQMAVHVPLSAYAQAEARTLMLSSHNLFSPANGNPVVAPTQDIVLGSYYLTTIHEDQKPSEFIFATPQEAMLAYDERAIGLHDPIRVRLERRLETQWLLGQDQEAIGRKLAAQDIVSPENAVVVTKNTPLTPESVTALDEAGITEFLVHEVVGDNKETAGQTTVGRLILNQILPPKLKYTDRYLHETLTKKAIGAMVSEVNEKHGKEMTIKFLDDLKAIGFRYATSSGVTISITDMDVPAKRAGILSDTEQAVAKLSSQYRRGTITLGERKQQVITLWMEAADKVAEAIIEGIDHFNPVYLITDSGARGSSKQIAQLSGMRGLMADPFGNLIEDLPIKSNFHEGLNVLEYFVSTHGARKGLADTALRTADAGYLTRRLVDVAQDVIVRADDCGTTSGIYVEKIIQDGDVMETLEDRIRGRYASEDIINPETGEVIVGASEEITDAKAHEVDAAGVKRVGLRSVLTCELRQGVCAKCYGRDLANGKLVDIGVAVGIIAAQSIGEPGTQLTMRTFHTGGIAGKYLTGVANVKQKKASTLRELHDDIKSGVVDFGSSQSFGANAGRGAKMRELRDDMRTGQVVFEDEKEERRFERERSRAIQALIKVLEDQVHGLLRVVELFEARKPKGQAIITEAGGVVAEIETRGLRHVIIHSDAHVDDPSIKIVGEIAADDILDDSGEPIIKKGESFTDKVMRHLAKQNIKDVTLRKAILVPYRGDLEVKIGDVLAPGSRLTDGPLDPQKVLELQGPRGVQDYLVREIQRVYKGQGVDINDKHIEVIVRQMLRKRRIRHPGDAPVLPGQIVDKFAFEDCNDTVRAAGGTEATADWVLLGITEASLATDSFLSAASFQKTTRVLTEAAVRGKKDELLGLKENVIIGRLIPAGTGLRRYRSMEPATPDGERIVVEPAARPERTLLGEPAAETASKAERVKELLSMEPDVPAVDEEAEEILPVAEDADVLDEEPQMTAADILEAVMMPLDADADVDTDADAAEPTADAEVDADAAAAEPAADGEVDDSAPVSADVADEDGGGDGGDAEQS